MRNFVQSLEPRLFLSAAEPVIVVGTHALAPDKANQVVKIYVTGGEAVAETDFRIQVADGGTSVGGKIAGPTITGVNILKGTIWAANNSGVFGALGYAPQDWDCGTTTSSGTVNAQGLLATVTVSTVGYASGTWQLLMSGMATGNSDFGPIQARITNGSIAIVQPTTALASISGTVFDDLNGNGRQNPGEAGLAGWTVELFAGKTEITSQVTGANGNYDFTGLAAGNYEVVVVPKPATYKPTGKSLTGWIIDLHAGKASIGNVFGEKPIA